jgi:hypothetical protein
MIKIFSDIYKKGLWGKGEFGGNGSGTGSSLAMTIYTREIIENVVKKYSIKSICDIPCGAMNWMPNILDKIDIEYIGLDIVEEVIQKNQIKYKKWKFLQFDMTKNIVPNRYDLILCRDVLQHFSFNAIVDSLENFSKSESKYILLGSYDSNNNICIKTGEYFDINLLKKPFLLPHPIEIFHENTHIISREPEKLLLLYEINTLKNINFTDMRSKLLLDS